MNDNYKILETESPNNVLDKIDVYLSTTNDIMRNANSLANSMPLIMEQFVEIRKHHNILEAQLEALRLHLGHNIEKFKAIVCSAEKRLDHQLDTLDNLVKFLLENKLNTNDLNEIHAQKQIMDAIQMANERFNRELELLYSF